MRALIVVDMQNDFMPGGALSVPDGNETIPVINSLMYEFDHVLATQDWHPQNHTSFAENHPDKKPGDIVEVKGIEQILWPVHCVEGSIGADFVDDLHKDKIERVFRKGIDPYIDDYSTFFDNKHARSTGLGDYLKGLGVNEVYIAGLATDYCVLYSALDALALGFKTYVVLDGCRAINLHFGDDQKALDQIEEKGGHIIQSSDLG